MRKRERNASCYAFALLLSSEEEMQHLQSALSLTLEREKSTNRSTLVPMQVGGARHCFFRTFGRASLDLSPRKAKKARISPRKARLKMRLQAYNPSVTP